MTVLLEARGVVKRFGGLTAVNRVDLQVQQGSITSIIGPNGAGKTTFFNTITGLVRIDEGQLLLGGKKVPHRPDKVARMGITRTFQNIRLFRDMNVIENVLVAFNNRLKATYPGTLLGTRHVLREEEEAVAEALGWLDYVGLRKHANVLATEMPYGAQRLLEIARAMGGRPKLLLLDEPAAGLNPRESSEMTNLIRSLRDDFGVTVILIEHDMGVVMKLSDHIAVLNYGEKIAEGTPDEIRNNPRVIEAYLGKSTETGAEGA